MDLEIFKDIENSIKTGGIKEFINELSDYLEDLKENNKSSDKNIENGNNNLSVKEQNKKSVTEKDTNFTEKLLDEEKNKINEYREEDCLYQVVDRSRKGIYLQNMNNNVVFEETNIPRELEDKIGNDYILRYKNGTYIFEEELTDNFFEGLIDIKNN